MNRARSLILAGEALVPHPARREDHTASPAASNTRNAHETTVALARGDAAVFEVFYRAWFPKLLGLAIRTTGRDEAFALDVVQDAFVRVIRAPRICPTEPELAGWLRTCVLSAAVDKLRGEARRAVRERRNGLIATNDHTEPHGQAEATERLDWLARRLAELGTTDHDLVRLRFDIQRSLAEIAAEAGGARSWSSVHGRVRRLVDRMKLAASEYFA